MPEFWLSLGSNIQPEKNIPACMKALREKFKGIKVSSIYETDPVGPAGTRKFWNAGVIVNTPLGREAFQKEIAAVEAALGRRRDPADKFAPREIDIDILPQPGYQQFGFCVLPLAEIMPETHDPETGKTFRDLAAILPSAGIKKLSF